MKLKFSLLFLLSAFFIQPELSAQKKSPQPAVKNSTAELKRPKLVVGLVVDQMRWDYFYRFYNRYSNGGLKRLLTQGFSVENTFIPYTPTYTACGHTTVYTGSVPAIHGIIGNNWVDPTSLKNVYCCDDATVKTVGSENAAVGQMSPKNMLTTTITDELRLATNFRSKVIGIALKDRGSILPAGHSGNAAYWYDSKTGNWVTSTYYMENLPMWVTDYNKMKLPNKFYEKDWNTLYPIASYTESTADNKSYEGKTKGDESPVFPHLLKRFMNQDYGVISSTPYGNTMTLDFAKLAILSEDLGTDKDPDFLAVSLSSTDYVGHQYGPNSIELEDTYLRLDKDLEEFFNYLDKHVGKEEYLVFLTADHAASHVPGFLEENKIPGGRAQQKDIVKILNPLIQTKFKIEKAIITGLNNQILFDHKKVEESGVDFGALKAFVIKELKKQPGVYNAVDLAQLGSTALPEPLKTYVTNGYHPRRSADIYFLNEPGWSDVGPTGTTHGSWSPYDAHIPLVFMGWGVKQGATNQTYYMTDIASTLAALLHIQMPNGAVGRVITEITNPK